MAARVSSAASPAALAALKAWADEERTRSAIYHLRQKIARSADTLEYIDHLIAAGVPADVGRPLTFEDRAFWRPIYRAMWGPTFVVMSSAQVGKTIMLFHGLHALAHLYHYQGRGIWHGLYLPTREMVATFSKGRLAPIIEAATATTGVTAGDFRPKQLDEAEKASKAQPGKRPSDSYNFKTIGRSHIYLAWMKGTLVDALPLDVVWLDEVRLMDPGRVDRVEKRIMGSAIGWAGYTSTAGMPGDAIAVRWEQSDQRRWHHPCNCPDGVDLAEHWPNCLGERTGTNVDPAERFYLYCPRCGVEVKDRSAGQWIPKNASGLYPGFSPNQLMTQQPLARIAGAWRRSDRNTQEFYNSVLGLAYLDREACPITEDVLNATVNEDVLWARPRDVQRCAMGIDQMGGVNYYVLTSRTPAGKRRLVRLEIDFSTDPFKRAAELMHEYDVSICVLEPLPNYNDALRFANAFPGRVFLVHYSKQMPDGQMRWGDLDNESDGEAIVAQEQKTRYTVRVEQTKVLDALATHWKERLPEVPNPRTALQRVPSEHGGEIVVEICREVYFDHLQRIARRQVTETKLADGIEVKEKTGRVKYHWVKLARNPSGSAPAPVKGAASDPHFAFADLMNWIAWTRLQLAAWTPKLLYL